jgi:hypothetical protein
MITQRPGRKPLFRDFGGNYESPLRLTLLVMVRRHRGPDGAEDPSSGPDHPGNRTTGNVGERLRRAQLGRNRTSRTARAVSGRHGVPRAGIGDKATVVPRGAAS